MDQTLANQNCDLSVQGERDRVAGTAVDGIFFTVGTEYHAGVKGILEGRESISSKFLHQEGGGLFDMSNFLPSLPKTKAVCLRSSNLSK